MRHQIKFAEMHTDLFLNGKNHGKKLYESTDLKMIYDEETETIAVNYKGALGIHHFTQFVTVQPHDHSHWMEWFTGTKEPTKRKTTHVSHASKLDIASAQVGDPSRTLQNPTPTSARQLK